MPKNLLIVESPAKAKTIEKILGKDFTVKSSFGHVRDLDKGEGAVDVNNGFKPKYIISPEKIKVVKELKEAVKKVDEVWLATDEDREGEAISWHLCQVLGLNERTTKRIVFREITGAAIQKAVQQPRLLDLNLVDAQQARRILDRLVGFELSSILWKKIRGKLSAGRVQSVAVKLIVEREREITGFDVTPFFRINAVFNVKNEQGKMVELKAESPLRYDKEADAEAFLKKCVGAAFSIADIEVKPLRRKPTAPFTTSTLQQEASRKLGFSVNRTMSVAQKLYEAGHITYMRTDSTSLSETAIQSIQQEIESSFGAKYVEIRRFKSKSANAQEAHEAIRPTYIDRQQVSANREEQRLYELIWKRTIASQMADAILEKTIARINVSTVPDARLSAEGEVLKFDGFLRVYLESKDDDEDDETSGMLPPLTVGQQLPLQQMTATERFTRPPARYTEAGLVSKLEELGIGRPSTYAPTITRIMEPERGYVVRETRDGEERRYALLTLSSSGQVNKEVKTEITGAVKNRLFPTDMGMVVSDFLDEHFDNIMDYSFTADIEKQFDDIANGQMGWVSMLDSFYVPFHKVVEATVEGADRPSNERMLGTDPKTGRSLLTRMSRRGPVVQIGAPDELDEGEKPQYANLRPGQSMESITFEEALKLFDLPRDLGEFRGKVATVGVGRYGPYIRYDEKFISLAKGEDPMEVTFERAQELILEKEKADAPFTTFKGFPVTKGAGRFGPFIKWNGIFVNIPAKYKIDTLTPEQAFELIEVKQEKEANRYVQQWEEENIAIENGRWGPFIRFGKSNVKLPVLEDGSKATSESAAQLSLEEVKKIIAAEIPGAFDKKPAAKAKAPTKAKAKAAPKAKASTTTKAGTTTKKTITKKK